MWIDKALNEINQDLHSMERHKEAVASTIRNQRPLNIVNPHGYQRLSESKIWNRTKDEQIAFNKFNDKIRGYQPYSHTQQRTIDFTKTTNQKYRSFTADEDREELVTYIGASRYWKKETVTIMARDKKKLKIVYASNDDMQCIIFEYLGTMIISTMSSFDNYLRDIEGKSLDIPQEKRIKRKLTYKTKLYKALEPREEDTTMIANKLVTATYEPD